MRRALSWMVALAALSACTVETEGAACDTPGPTDQCPSGQQCGIDGKCAKDAVTDCDAAPAGSVLAVDPVQGSTVGTGLANPAGCRFRSLVTALAATGTEDRTVKVYGNGAAVTIALDAAEPLVVRGNVSLTTDAATPTPASYVLSATGATGDLVHLEGGATLRGFTVRNGTATGDGIVVVCGTGTGEATLEHVNVEGASALTRGVVVAGACGLAATALDVSGVNGPGLVVATATAGVGATVEGGAFHDNVGTGVIANEGHLALTGTETEPLTVIKNGTGVVLEPLSGTIDAALTYVRAAQNTGVGIQIRSISSSKVTVLGSQFVKNGFTQYATANQRKVGGVLLYGNAPSSGATTGFTFKGNLICANGDDTVDQMGVQSTDNWSIAGDTACPAGDANVFGISMTGMLIFTTAGNMDASYNAFAVSEPGAGQFSRTDWDPPCAQSAVPPPACN